MTQDEYIEILFGDLGFTLAQRKDWLELRSGKRNVDELTQLQKSLVIEKLKDLKAESKEGGK